MPATGARTRSQELSMIRLPRMPSSAGALAYFAAWLVPWRPIFRARAPGSDLSLFVHRSRQPVHQRAVPALDGRSWRRLFDEPFGPRLGQCGDGELLLLAEDRANGAQNLSDARSGQG